MPGWNTPANITTDTAEATAEMVREARRRQRATNRKRRKRKDPNVDERWEAKVHKQIQARKISGRYRAVAESVLSDMGGKSQCTEARLQLVRRFAGLSVQAEAMEAEMEHGEKIDVRRYSVIIMSLVRVVAKL